MDFGIVLMTSRKQLLKAAGEHNARGRTAP